MGRLFWAALLLCLNVHPVTAGTLRVVGQGGAILVEETVAEGGEWCLSWNHSVTGGAVRDCFADRVGRMILDRSYLHDFAAGLGEVAGRGRIEAADGGGYWIRDMDDPIADNTLALRVGQHDVDHRLHVGGHVYVLSDLAAGQRVVLQLIEKP
ncbi:DUF1850 domain-containing protein [Roseovarius sp. M141]|uniref:DUF1850 domain-containing protein n=1 Tax=Roseovarius sp. M141 TaxID=2583806 RepID=UPI0020CF59F6|nr:DUF1850 domain-containing protein [Roseovarius sp. M141]MCQ0092826.1 DUF1850 domain-containing protein [Roseovarius sp. M141]